MFSVINLKKYASSYCVGSVRKVTTFSVARSVSLASYYYSKHIYPAVLLVPGKAQVFTKALGLLIYTMFIKQVSATRKKSLSMSLLRQEGQMPGLDVWPKLISQFMDIVVLP